MDDLKDSMDEALEAILERWPGTIHERAVAADRALMERVPRKTREIDPNGRLVGYMLGPGYKGTLFTLLLSTSGVKVGFNHGATLPDPTGLLGGLGKVHRTFTVSNVGDVKNPAFGALVNAAYAAYLERTA
jgi:hypothetical protein